MDKKQMKELTEQLEQGILSFLESDAYKAYLSTASRFHTYSLNNTILIALQKPDATRVAGYKTWSDLGRQVKKDEKAIRIFAPTTYTVTKKKTKIDPATGLAELDSDGNPVVIETPQKVSTFHPIAVFDISQTEGEELPEHPVHELSGSVKDYEDFFSVLEDISPVPVEIEEITSGALGYYNGQKIAVKADMSEVQTVKTLLHELAHAMHEHQSIKVLHDRKDKATKEIEAESTAFMVANHFGIDTSEYSFGYVASWGSGRGMKELKASLNKILDVSSGMIKLIEERMRERGILLEHTEPEL